MKRKLVNVSPLDSLRPGSCYETATMRKFYHGRTETMRPCTQETVNWCKAMMDPACDVKFQNVFLLQNYRKGEFSHIQNVTQTFFSQANARRKMLLLAFNKHNKLMSEAQEGNGGFG